MPINSNNNIITITKNNTKAFIKLFKLERIVYYFFILRILFVYFLYINYNIGYI